MSDLPPEDRLLPDKKLYETLMNSIRGIFWECDPMTFQFSYVSPQAERILGYPCRQWIEDPDFWRSHIHSDDVEWCTAYCRDATEKSQDHEFEYRMVAADGRIVWLHDIVTVVCNNDGAVCLRGIMIDKTEAKLAEMKLRSGEERFRLAMQGANDGVWDWDLSTDEVYYSPRWKSMLGYAEDELESHLRTWKRLVHPEDCDTTLTMAQDYLEGRVQRFEAEFRLRHRDGHYITVLSRAFLSRDEEGKTVRLVGTHVDITRLKQTEEDLHLTKFCVEQAPMGILRFALDGTVLSANNHSCQSLGYSREELCGMSVFDFDPVFTREMWHDQLQIQRESGSLTFETIHQGTVGARFPVEITTSRLEYHGSEFLYSFERDITERRRAEQTLREQEELYSAMVNQAPDGVVLVDTETLGFKEFNDLACEGLGYSREEFAKLTVLDINAEYPREWHIGRIPEIIAQGHAVFDSLHRHRDGSLRNVRISERVVQIRGRHYFIGFWTDITEHFRLLETLRLREHYQRALLDNFPFAAWMKDEEGRYLAVNRQLAAFLGLASPDELVGKTDFDVLKPELSERIAEEDRKVLTSGRTKHAEEQLPANGEYRWFEVYQSPVAIDGRIIGTVGCNWDITERKIMEKALTESEERYRRLVELSPDAVFIHTEARFVFMNATAARLLGADKPETLYGRAAFEFFHPDCRDAVERHFEYAWPHTDNPPVEELLVRPDGSTVPVEMVSVYFNFKGADSVLTVARDISERKKMQDELVKMQKLESLGLLAGGIAHDFNNILTGILGNLSLARLRLDPAHNIARQIDECEKATFRARDLAQQLLTFARGGEPVKKLLDPASLICETTSFVLHDSKVSSVIDMADDLWCVEADIRQLSQVLHNILINALQAMPHGGEVTVRAMNEMIGPVNAYQLDPGDYLKIVIKDNGCGISPEDLPKIFDPYFTTKSQGSGLGLSSVYSIVRRHGGTVEAASIVGVGSTFSIYLPASSCMLPDGAVIRKDALLAGSGRILVMDDEDIVREIVSEILEFIGYNVETCTNGKEAVELFRSAHERNVPFDVVILDLTVPGGMGGKEAATQLLEIDPEAVLIVSSGYFDDPVVANFRQYGFRDAMSKPFTASSLARGLEKLISKKHLKSKY